MPCISAQRQISDRCSPVRHDFGNRHRSTSIFECTAHLCSTKRHADISYLLTKNPVTSEHNPTRPNNGRTVEVPGRLPAEAWLGGESPAVSAWGVVLTCTMRAPVCSAVGRAVALGLSGGVEGLRLEAWQWSARTLTFVTSKAWLAVVFGSEALPLPAEVSSELDCAL